MTTSRAAPHVLPSTLGVGAGAVKVSWWPETHLSRLGWLACDPQGARLDISSSEITASRHHAQQHLLFN